MNNIQTLIASIAQERKRLKSKPPSIEQLHTELHGTVLDLLQELAAHTDAHLTSFAKEHQGLGEWASQSMQALSGALQQQGERIDQLEELTDDTVTTITAEDAELLLKNALDCRALCEALLDGPFPINKRDADGQAQLREMIERSKAAEKIIIDATLTEGDEPDDDDGEDEEAADEANEEPSSVLS